jgi:hypothetical protein
VRSRYCGARPGLRKHDERGLTVLPQRWNARPCSWSARRFQCRSQCRSPRSGRRGAPRSPPVKPQTRRERTGCRSAWSPGYARWNVGGFPRMDLAVRIGITDEVDLGLKIGTSRLEASGKFQLTDPRRGAFVASIAPSIGGLQGSSLSGNSADSQCNSTPRSPCCSDSRSARGASWCLARVTTHPRRNRPPRPLQARRIPTTKHPRPIVEDKVSRSAAGGPPRGAVARLKGQCSGCTAAETSAAVDPRGIRAPRQVRAWTDGQSIIGRGNV